MKKLFFVPLLLAMVTSVGFLVCSESDKVHSKAKVSKGDLFSQLNYYSRADLQDKEPTEIRTIFNAITPQNRYDLFVDKLDHCLSLNSTSSQASVINDIKAEMTVGSYTWGSSEHTNFINAFLPSILTSLEQEFSSLEGLNVFFNLYDLEGLNDVQDGGGYSSDDECSCNQGSFFGGCQFGGDNCDDETCEYDSHGCGFGFFFECDGL